jgi:hypothetical protein
MERYIISRNKRRHLVVSDDVHQALLLYASERQLTLVEATCRLLTLGLCHEYDLPTTNSNVDEYEIKKPRLFDLQRWVRKVR